jgi:hypothetical protein
LTINDGDAQLLGLRRVKQHSFHLLLPRSMCHGMGKAVAATLARRGDIQLQSVAVLNILCKADSKFFGFACCGPA